MKQHPNEGACYCVYEHEDGCPLVHTITTAKHEGARLPFSDVKRGDRVRLTAATGSHAKHIGRAGTVTFVGDVRPDMWATFSLKVTVLFDGDKNWNAIDCFSEYGDVFEKE